MLEVSWKEHAPCNWAHGSMTRLQTSRVTDTRGISCETQTESFHIRLKRVLPEAPTLFS